MSKETIDAKVSDIIPDDKNLNSGTEYGAHLMDKSFRQFGAGRSILLDKNNRVIAGNKSLETFAAIGMDKVRIIETTGDELIAVKRTDVDLDSKQGREMALADNATSKANLEWDGDMLKSVQEEYDINADDWGVITFDDESFDVGDLDLKRDFNETLDHFDMSLTFENKYKDLIEGYIKEYTKEAFVNACIKIAEDAKKGV